MRYFALTMLVCVFSGALGCQTAGVRRQGHGDLEGAPHASHDRPHRDINAYMAAMESPQRAAWQKPDQVLAALKLRPGERVADVGAGPGYFTLPIAEAVGKTGKVWAVDIEPKMLDRCRERANAEGIDNIQYILAREDDPLLPDGGVDTIFIVDTYHHFGERPAYVARLRRALADGGRIVIIDFVPKSREERGFGPPLSMQLSQATVDEEMATADLRPALVHTFLPEQYFVEYRVQED